MQLGCFGFHRQIYPQEGDSKKKWKIEFFGKFDMPNNNNNKDTSKTLANNDNSITLNNYLFLDTN